MLFRLLQEAQLIMMFDCPVPTKKQLPPNTLNLKYSKNRKYQKIPTTTHENEEKTLIAHDYRQMTSIPKSTIKISGAHDCEINISCTGLGVIYSTPIATMKNVSLLD